MDKYKQYARQNFKAGDNINDMWHADIQAECRVIQKEADDAKKLERIKQVVEKTADISTKFTGNIVVRCSFEGSLPKKRKLTKTEKALVFNLPSDVKAPIGGDKELFTSKEYDDLVGFVSNARHELANMGIPHIKFEAAHVVSIMRIPDIEEWAERTQKSLDEYVDKLIAAYPDQITPEATKLGPLYNAVDYRPVETLKALFRFDYSFISVGVPNELKDFNVALYKKMQKQAQETWKEIERNGVLLLRETVSNLVAGLVDSLTPKEGGDKKKFYASSVTKIVDFIETFKGRNICGDTDLDKEVEKLRDLVTGVDVKSLSTDMALRETVKKSMEGVQERLKPLLVAASSRAITLED